MSMMSKRVGNPYPGRYKEKEEETLTEDEYQRYLENAEALDRTRLIRKTNPQHLFDHNIKTIKISALLATLNYAALRVSEIVGDRPCKYEVMWRPNLVGTFWEPDPNEEYRPLKRYPEQPEGYSEKRFPNGFIYKWTKEIHGLRKRDMRITKKAIRVDPKEIRKHGKRDEPLWIPLKLPGANHIVEQWEVIESRNDRVFPISKWSAWSFISQVTEGRLYPHYFRLNRATKFAEHEKTSILDLQQWFGWVDPRTIRKYLGKGGRVTRRMARRLKG